MVNGTDATLANIALQLWSIREHAERDMAGALGAVAEPGYRAVEFAGLGDAAPADVRRVLDALGLQPIGAHVPLGGLRERLPAVIETMQTLACRRVVLPSVTAASFDHALRLADECNALGAKLAAAGIAFAYHNESADWLPLDGTTLWHTLARNTDPGLVELQLDVPTALRMGIEPAPLLREYRTRITSVHLGDIRASRTVAIGAGTIDWPPLLAAATSVEWLIVELDDPPDPLLDVKTSLVRLRELLT